MNLLTQKICLCHKHFSRYFDFMETSLVKTRGTTNRVSDETAECRTGRFLVLEQPADIYVASGY